MDVGPQQFGKWLIGIGSVIVIVGLLMLLLGKTGLFRLPGDFEFGGRNWRVYFPLATYIILSILLTFILLLISYKSFAKWRLGLLEEGKIFFVIFPSETVSASPGSSWADYSRKSKERFP